MQQHALAQYLGLGSKPGTVGSWASLLATVCSVDVFEMVAWGRLGYALSRWLGEWLLLTCLSGVDKGRLWGRIMSQSGDRQNV